MIRQHKSYSRPKKAYEKSRITEENKLVERFGLKNKREIWKAKAKVSYFRDRAKALAKAPSAEQEVLFGKLRGLGLPVNVISDVLALQVEDILNRRLPTILFKQHKAQTIRQARQMVTHRKVLINDSVVNKPGYLVPVNEEQAITVTLIFTKPSQTTEETE
ncbi:30S ribosomal protein S4 [Candidatus Pacearchaeota archaeon]|nr:30S ribosomal protein S4 [Candidatus Pacearchaeota archaeon]